MNSKRKPPKKPPVGTPHPVEDRPLNPPIERLPGLGKTWYKRGTAYWMLRIVVAFLLFLPFMVGCIMTGGVGYGVWQSDLPLVVRVLILLVMVAAIVRSSIKAWSAFIRVGHSNRDGNPMTLAEATGDTTSPRARRRAATSAAARGTAAAMGATLSGALLVISGIVNLGWFVVLFLSGLQRYYGAEYGARVRLQQWCDEHEVANPLKTQSRSLG